MEKWQMSDGKDEDKPTNQLSIEASIKANMSGKIEDHKAAIELFKIAKKDNLDLADYAAKEGKINDAEVFKYFADRDQANIDRHMKFII